MQVHLYRELLVDPSSCISEPSDLVQRKHPVLLKLSCFIGRLSPVVGKR